MSIQMLNKKHTKINIKKKKEKFKIRKCFAVY